MKRIIIFTVILIIGINEIYAQDNQKESNTSVYTFFVNIVNEQWLFPLIGFVNIASGSHVFPQIGFINWNQINFNGFQTGFVNTVGGNMTGFQMGFVNTIGNSFSGVQLGFVNTVAGEDMQGLQLGYVNIAKKINGFQLGFINYADSIDNGIPIGFISIVRNGGFRAIELSVNELAPLSLAFKIGVEKFYTSIIVSYNFMKSEIKDAFFNGLGFGTIIPINNFLFLNPELELVFSNRILGNNQIYLSFAPNIGFRIISGLSILVSPSITWAYTFNRELSEPFFSIINYKINDKNNLLVSARLALRYEW